MHPAPRRLRHLRFAFFLMGVVAALVPAAAWGQDEAPQRPATEDLLPETTVLFFQIDDIRNFVDQLSQSSVGQMLKDEKVAPLVDDLWTQAQSAYHDYEDKIGVSLEDLQAFPTGEVSFAIIVPRGQSPLFMLIIETGEDSEATERVLDRARSLVHEDGKEITTTKNDDDITFESFPADGKTITFFQKDGLLVGCSSEKELNHFLDRWMGREVKKVRPLSANRKFITIMNRCRGTQALPPEMRFYMDPIALIKASTRGNMAAQAGLSFLPVVGLDGLLAIGGSSLFNEEGYRSVAHFHVMLANPRSGIFEMLAFKPTDYQPEPWMPSDISNYFTTSWDIDQMMAELTKMIETFQGEGAVDKWFTEEVDKNAGFDVREEVLGGLTGRVTFTQWIERPVRINSQVSVIAFELKDPEAFEKTLDKIVDRINQDAEEGEDTRVKAIDYRGVRILGPSPERMEKRIERRRQRIEALQAKRGNKRIDIEFEAPRPGIAIVGNYLVISPQSQEFLRHVIDTDQGEFESLADNQEYERVSEQMTRLLGTDMPSGMLYARPVETFRFMFELTKDDGVRSFLASQADKSPYIGGVQNAFTNHPLPDFSDLEHYFQPQGGFMTSDDSGFHFLIFELAPEEAPTTTAP